MITDPRSTPARPDLAAEHLRDKVAAERYAVGQDYHVIESAAPVRKDPRPDAALLTEALYGEAVIVYEEREGWVWAQLSQDGYVGYLPLQCLSPAIGEPSHQVSVLRTYIYPKPDIKSPPWDLISLNSRLCITRELDDFTQLSSGGFIYTAHISPIGDYVTDFVAVAEKFAGTPYLWGGKRSLGLDCSGLLQVALQACGISALRDSDMLQEQLGAEIPLAAEFSGLRRGDLIFWQGHCGIMCDAINLLHSNGHHMATVIEPLAEARDRISSLYGEITMIKRLPDYSPAG